MKVALHIILVFILVSMTTSCHVSVNKSLQVEDGKIVRNGINSVNGNVIVGRNCIIYGNCRSVNGNIEIGASSETRGLQTVNGKIDIADDAYVDGNIQSVNGSINCEENVQINGKVGTVNGKIKLYDTKVRRNLSTFNGDITLQGKSLVQGDIIIKRAKGTSHGNRRLKINIYDDSVVEGDIIVRDPNISVEVYLINGGKVHGKIENAEIIEHTE